MQFKENDRVKFKGKRGNISKILPDLEAIEATVDGTIYTFYPDGRWWGDKEIKLELAEPSGNDYKLQEDYDKAMDEYLDRTGIEPKDTSVIGEYDKAVMKQVSEDLKKSKTENNGGNTDYYAVPENAITLNDLIEHKKMNFAQGNIFKANYCLNDGRHSGTTPERELNKIIYYANRELERLKRESN